MKNEYLYAISVLEGEILNLRKMIESSYDESDRLERTELPAGAVWSIPVEEQEEKLFKFRNSIELQISGIVATIKVIRGQV